MNDVGTGTPGINPVIFAVAIALGVGMIVFAPALIRFQIRMLRWHIALLEQPWAAWPARFAGTAVAALGLFGLLHTQAL